MAETKNMGNALALARICEITEMGVRMDSPIEILGDSLDLVFLLNQLEDKTGQKYPNSSLGNFLTVGDLARFVAENA